jgi:hypothetical protein
MIIKIFGLAILGFFIAEYYGPIQYVKNYFKLYNYKATSWLYCVKCCSFNLALIVTLDLYLSAIICILSIIISYTIDLINKHRYGN